MENIDDAKKAIRKVGFVVNATIAASPAVSRRAEHLLHDAGVEVDSCPDGTTASWTPDDNLDCIFSFGGDGTILRASRISAPLHVPIVGVNLGRVGFLTEFGPDVLEQKIAALLAGEYWVEKRATLNAELWRGGERIGQFQALNDVVASRAALSRVVDCTLMVNGQKVTTYVADGVIVATPTGSTAYSMAAGGPIMHPELKAVIVTPIAPYLTIIRSLILPDDSQIELDITTDDESFLTVDGQSHVALQDGDAIRINVSPDPCLFVRLGARTYFGATLSSKLQRKD